MRGHRDHRHPAGRGRQGADRPGGGEPVHPRHHDVHQHQVEGCAGRASAATAAAAVRHRLRRMAEPLAAGRSPPPVGRDVLGHQHPQRRPAAGCRRRGGRAPAAGAAAAPPGRCCRRPRALSTAMLPPMLSSSRRQIARPSPSPPKRRAVELSAWAKGSNSRACGLRRDADAGIGDGDAASRQPPAASRRAPRRPRVMRPASVNFTALSSSFSSTWRSRSCVAERRRRQRGVELEREVRAPSPRRAARSARPSRRRSARGSKAASCSGDPAAFQPRDVEDVVHQAEQLQPRLRAPSAGLPPGPAAALVSSSTSDRPITAFSGVRSSWLTMARNSVRLRSAASAASRAVSCASQRRAGR